MDTTAERFASEWRDLQKKRQQLIHEEDELRRRLASLPEDPTMRGLLEEKRGLKKKALDLPDTIGLHKMEIENRDDNLARRRRALTDKQLQQTLDVRLQERRERLVSFEKLDTPRVILDHARRLIFELEAPIEEVAELYRQMNVKSERKLEASRRALHETLERIKAIESHYRETKCHLEDAIREVGRKRQECYTEEIEWATQSRSHLEWMMRQEPSYQNDIVRRYKVRFPNDSLLDLFPPHHPNLNVQQGNRKKRRAPHHLPSPPLEENDPALLPTWRFWITFHANEDGQELPLERDQFLLDLQAALHKGEYRSLSVTLVYDKLTAVTRMSVPQRQMIKKLSKGEEPLGWKVVRVGRKHRLFLLVDEQERHIRFLPRQRRISYSQH